MQQLTVYDQAVRDFVDGLKSVIESKYLKQRTTRTPEELQKVILTTSYYHKAILVLYGGADKLMMTPRIEMIPLEKRTEFIKRYKQSYSLYAELLTQLLTVFTNYQEQKPSDWDYQKANDILMKMDALMAEAHSRF